MVWVRLDDTTPIERRHRQLSDSANWLLVAMVAYSNRELTDGRVDRAELDAVRPGADPEQRAAALAQLEQAGAIEATDDGWTIVWLIDLQPTAAETRTRKEQERERQRRHREKKAEMRDATRDATRESQHPVPSRPVPIPEAAEATAAAGRIEAERSPLDSHGVAREWHRAMHMPGGCSTGSHAESSWRTAYEVVASVCNAEARPKRALCALCEWFWTAPGGPIQSERLPRRRANPGHLAKYVSSDLDAAAEWWLSQRAAPGANAGVAQ